MRNFQPEDWPEMLSPKLRDEYARARSLKGERWIDQLVPMSDQVIGQEMAIVTATRNVVEVRKWVASRLMPNQYGDQPSSVTINNQTGIVMVSEDGKENCKQCANA